MKRLWLLTILFFSLTLSAQQLPQALRSDVVISKVIQVHLNAVRIVYDHSGNFYYNTADGNIYQLIKNDIGEYHELLTYTVNQHGIEYLMGMVLRNGVLYLSGNNNTDSSYTTGIIRKGVPDASGNRIWSTVAETEPYQTGDAFNHLMSGLVLNPAGDTLIICNGSRGDHGEVNTRNQLFPGLRNTPLTSIVLCVPVSANQLVLKNDSQWLATNGYVYARGARNFFDMAYCANGDLFALENSCDRDHNEEMNWLRRGMHYGFPWKIGSTLNPVVRKNYNPDTDLLLPIDCWAKSLHSYFYDSLFPPPPAGVQFVDPILNMGPDADKFKDTLTGMVVDASDAGIPLQTFTAHRTPLGLVFDNDSVLVDEFRGHAFMLSYNKGLDSANSLPPNNRIGPFLDPSEDLLHLELQFDNSLNNYKLYAHRIIVGLHSPVDAEMVGNVIYVMENMYSGSPFLWKVELPLRTDNNPSTNFHVTVFPNPTSDYVNMNVFMKESDSFRFELTNLQGQLLLSYTDHLHSGVNTVHVPIQSISQGMYFAHLTTGSSKFVAKILVDF